MAAPSNLILDTVRPGAAALVLMGTVFVVMSLLFLLTPFPPTQSHAFLFVLGFVPGVYLLWTGGRRRRIWLSKINPGVIERRELLGFRRERRVPLEAITGVKVEIREVAVRRKVWQQMLKPTPVGSGGPTTAMHEIMLAGAYPPLMIERWHDATRASSRAKEIAKVGGWLVVRE